MIDSPLRRLALGCHGALALLLAVAVLTSGGTPATFGMAAALAAPLVAMLYALLTRRRGAERWTSVLLVPYAGGLSVEVVARAGSAPLLGAALLACVLEITLLLALIQARGRPRGGRV
jgi:hypothetical protein